jgi:hypothetical protein
VLGKPGLLLIEIDGKELEIDRGAALQREQDVEQSVGVLAARQADHDTVTRRDHAEVFDRLADGAAQPRLQTHESARVSQSACRLHGRGSQGEAVLGLARGRHYAAASLGAASRYFAST